MAAALIPGLTAPLRHALGDARSIALDTSVIIASSDARDPRSACALALLDAVASARVRGTISTVNAAELLTGGFRESVERGLVIQAWLRSFPGLEIAAVDLEVATRAAGIRAVTRLPLPDAIVIATALARRCDVLVHGDGAWTRHTERFAPALRLIDLGRYCR